MEIKFMNRTDQNSLFPQGQLSKQNNISLNSEWKSCSGWRLPLPLAMSRRPMFTTLGGSWEDHSIVPSLLMRMSHCNRLISPSVGYSNYRGWYIKTYFYVTNQLVPLEVEVQSIFSTGTAEAILAYFRMGGEDTLIYALVSVWETTWEIIEF